MKTVIQRVKTATLKVKGETISHIDKGLVVYLGIMQGDTVDSAKYLARKIAHMRIFSDDNGKMNKSVIDIGGEILLISQFTLCASCKRGNRPDFINSEIPEKAKEMYHTFESLLIAQGVTVKMGVFGEDMEITQVNIGPVTITLDS